jgi:hypothetical protein
MLRLFVLVTGLIAVVLFSLLATAYAQATDGATQVDWSLLEARQRAYDAVRATDTTAATTAYGDLEAAAQSQGLTIPQFDGSPASNAGREQLNQDLGRLSGRVTPDGDQIPIEAVCSRGLCFTGAPAGRIRENAAADGALLDTWVAEEMPDAVYVQANPP